MNREDMIRMAREAGFDVEAIEGTDEVLERESDYYTRHPNIGYMVQTHTVERFAALVAQPLQERIQLLYKQLNEAEKQLDAQYQMGVEAEREACAKLFDAYLLTSDPGPLRARGPTGKQSLQVEELETVTYKTGGAVLEEAFYTADDLREIIKSIEVLGGKNA